jgi:hypothetical protein
MSSEATELELARAGFAPRLDVPPPEPIAGAAVELTGFEAQANGELSFVAACWRGSSPGWNAEVDELVEHRLSDLGAHFATKLVGPGDAAALRLVATDDRGGVTVQRLEGPTGVRALTFLGFRDAHPIACVVTCAPSAPETPGADPSTTACGRELAGAHLRAPLDAGPPSEGLLLGAASAMVHHPTATATGFVGLVAAIALVLVVRRPRRHPTRRRRTNF